MGGLAVLFVPTGHRYGNAWERPAPKKMGSYTAGAYEHGLRWRRQCARHRNLDVRSRRAPCHSSRVRDFKIFAAEEASLCGPLSGDEIERDVPSFHSFGNQPATENLPGPKRQPDEPLLLPYHGPSTTALDEARSGFHSSGWLDSCAFCIDFLLKKLHRSKKGFCF